MDTSASSVSDNFNHIPDFLITVSDMELTNLMEITERTFAEIQDSKADTFPVEQTALMNPQPQGPIQASMPMAMAMVPGDQTARLSIKSEKKEGYKDARQFIQDTQKKNTRICIQRDIRTLNRYQEEFYNEVTDILQMAPLELNELLSAFFVNIKKVDGSEYEPSSLDNMKNSFETYLADNGYGVSLDDRAFRLTQKALSQKKKDLWSQGKGRRPNASEEFQPEEEDKLWDSKGLGMEDGKQGNFTIWWILTKCMGLRSRKEHRDLQWGDIQIRKDVNDREYLEFSIERGTKKRDGGDLVRDPRKVKPKVWATSTKQCPVALFRKWSSKRPPEMCEAGSPFYLQTRWGKAAKNSEYWYFPRPQGINQIGKFIEILI